MLAHKAAAFLAVTVVLLFTCSCAQKPSENESTAEYDTVSNYDNSNLSGMPDFYADIEDEAQRTDSSVGRVALSMIICKLSDINNYSELTAQSAKELFELLKEEAARQNITLEKLDSTYCLGEILKSEQIYVSFSSNNVTYASDQTEIDESWQNKFQEAIAAPANK